MQDLFIPSQMVYTLEDVAYYNCPLPTWQRFGVTHLCIHSKNSGWTSCCTEDKGSRQFQLLSYNVHVIFLGGVGTMCDNPIHCRSLLIISVIKNKYLVFLNQGDQVGHTTDISDAGAPTQACSERRDVTLKEIRMVHTYKCFKGDIWIWPYDI